MYDYNEWDGTRERFAAFWEGELVGSVLLFSLCTSPHPQETGVPTEPGPHATVDGPRLPAG
jgi:hypothetical protein